MMRITALPTSPLLLSSKASCLPYQPINAVTSRRSGQDGTQTRQTLLNGTQTNQQVLSTFMREDVEEETPTAVRWFQSPTNNGCSKTPIATPAGYTKSFLI